MQSYGNLSEKQIGMDDFFDIICIFATLLYIHSCKPINNFSLMRYLDPKADLTFKVISKDEAT